MTGSVAGFAFTLGILIDSHNATDVCEDLKIEKSDEFVAKLQRQIAAQQLRLDGLHERLIAERDRASILEGQRRKLIEEVLVCLAFSVTVQFSRVL